MGLQEVVCAFAGFACTTVKIDCSGYHNHDLFKASMLAWTKLKKMQAAGSEACGYTDYAWNEPKICRHCFEDLNMELQQAVLDIGTDAHCWDSAVAKFKGFSDCVSRAPPPRKGKECVVSWGVHNSSYKAWQDLTMEQRLGAQKCHYHSASWDGPVDCVSCFEDLSLAKRKQLEKVGMHHAACWDQLMLKNGMDCDRMMTELPGLKERKKIYAAFLDDAKQEKFSLDPRLQSLLSPVHSWSSSAMMSTIALFIAAFAASVLALLQLRRDGAPAVSASRTSYSLVQCDDDFALE